MALTDNSPMPFGKYKGESMANVPAKYLEWCKKSLYPNTNDAREVLKYVMGNWDAIEKELKSGKSECDATESDIY